MLVDSSLKWLKRSQAQVEWACERHGGEWLTSGLTSLFRVKHAKIKWNVLLARIKQVQVWTVAERGKKMRFCAQSILKNDIFNVATF